MIKDINAYHVRWLCIFMGIGFITAFTLPYPISILLGFGAVVIINVIKNRLKLSDNDKAKLIRPNLITTLLLFNPTQFHQSLIYVCANCNNVHTNRLCPKCNSIMKKVL
ncbi:MAG TPA: hypothetical protein VIZ62_13145 [Nitrososphaeraceae archaeon]